MPKASDHEKSNPLITCRFPMFEFAVMNIPLEGFSIMTL